MDKSSLTIIFTLVIFLTLDYVELTKPKKEDNVDLWESFIDTVRDVGRQFRAAIYSKGDVGSNRHKVGAEFRSGSTGPYGYINADKVSNFFNALRLAYLKPWYPFKNIKDTKDK